jgi:demethylmenaquinone methyltransferase/2-methoxy-6-polyprenyl-1,4-benzoquinol methylase
MTDPLPAPERKAHYVRHMFSRIAHRYDLMNRLMTFGRDQAWRRYTVAMAVGDPSKSGSVGREADGVPGPKSERANELWVLDVATGTGDLALEVLRQRPTAKVTGLDFTPEMLVAAQEKANDLNAQVYLMAGDALRLPYHDGSYDAVVTGFAMRNVTDIPAAFAEMARVTRPGGRVACLEIAKPKTPLFRQMFGLYFYRLVPIVGGLITGQRSAYTYLPHSLTGFITPDEIAEVMRRTGWRQVGYKRLMLGTVAVHVGVRASGDNR